MSYNTELSTAIPTSKQQEEWLVQTLQSAIKGDYRARMPGEGQVARLLNELISRLESDTGSDLDRSVQLSIIANETTVLAARTLMHLRKIGARSEEIAIAGDQMEQSVHRISEHGASIAREIGKIKTTVHESSHSVKESVSSMKVITASVSETLVRVNSLKEMSKQIAVVAETIKGIAFQTNLLSLNANVEAAKAGDAGRGFAVVAKEVGNLARRSAEATKAIDDMVRKTQTEITDIVESMGISSKSVSQGQQSIESVGVSIEALCSQVERVSGQATQIANTLEEQVSAIQVLNKGISDTNQATPQSIEGVEQITLDMDALEKFVRQGLTKLSEKEIPNKVLKLAQADHMTWKKRLVNMAVGIEQVHAHELSDHHGCRLGKWYDQVRDPTLVNNPAFAALEGPHKEVHDYGIRAAQMYQQRNLEGMLAEIAKLDEASEEVLSILDYLDKTTG